MQTVWNYEDYVRFLDDDNPIIKEWASDRLVELFRNRAREVLERKRFDETIGKSVEIFFDEENRREKILKEKPRIDPERVSLGKILGYLFKHKENIPGQEQIIKYLLSFEKRDEIIRLSLEKLKKKPDFWGSIRAMRLLGELKAVETIPELTRSIGKERSDISNETAMTALISIGEPVLEVLEEIFTITNLDHTQIIYILGVLEGIPCQRSVDMVLKNFDYLWNEFNESLLECIYSLASKRFIEPLKRELRQYEIRAEEVYYLLCKLHSIEDPCLMDIRRRLEEEREHTSRVIPALMGKGDPGDLVDEYITMELRCTKCKKRYHYRVWEVLCSIKEDTKHEDIIIKDTIRCKNCGAIDCYEYTPNAMLAITATLMKMEGLKIKYNIRRDRWPIKIGEPGSFKGEPMGVEELLDEYKKKVKEEPHNPELRIGLGNTLKTLKCHEESLAEYKMAVELNPRAVEGWTCMAIYYADRDDFENAYKYQKRCIEYLPHGDFYRTQDIEKFKVAAYSNLEEFAEHLDEKIDWDEFSVSDDESKGQQVRQQKIGRNQPCPCGSGKKYKKCCLLKDESAKKVIDTGEVIKTPNTTVADSLRDRIMEYVEDTIPYSERENALGIYFGNKKKDKKRYLKDIETNMAFMDWFIHDYRLQDTGKTIIEKYYQEKGSSLRPDEREILEAWQDTKPSLYEITSVRPEQGLGLKGIFTGQEYEVTDISSSRSVIRWDIIYTRVIKIFGKYYLTGVGTLYPALQKKELIEFGREKYGEYQDVHGSCSWEEFMHNQGYIFKNYRPRHKYDYSDFATKEGHQIAMTKAYFQIKDMEEIVARFARVDDFKIVKEEFDDKNYLSEIQYVWLKKGKSEDIPQSTSHGKGGLEISSQWSESSSGPFITVLGDLTLTREELVLECISEERLEFGKRRLKEFLGDNVQFKVGFLERIDSIKRRLGRKPQIDQEKPCFPPPLAEHVLKKSMEGYFGEWVNTTIPALGGKTPLDAIKTPEGKQEVEEILKVFENNQERSKKDGQLCYDVNNIRKVLGLQG